MKKLVLSPFVPEENIMMTGEWLKIVLTVLLAVTTIGASAVHAEDNKREASVFEIDGRKLFYHDEGSGRPVLILHGSILFVPGSWDRTVDALVKVGCRVIFPQRAGRGQSDPHPVFLSLARDTRDMWALVDHLALGRVVLVGHSQGA